MEEELLFGLTPQEGWVWNYLLFLAERQGSARIIIPRPGEDLKAEKVFCRRHFKRLLLSLKVKRHLTNLIIPRSKSKQIEVLIPASKIADLGVRNNNLHDLGVRNKEAMMTPASAITPLGTPASAIDEVISATLPESTPSQAKLKESLKALIKQKQGNLIEEILKLKGPEVYQMRIGLRALCRFEARGNWSQHARLYATIRYIQEAGNIEKPQPWITTVAKRGQQAMEARWSVGKLGDVGRLPSRERFVSG